MKKFVLIAFVAFSLLIEPAIAGKKSPLVMMTDFGLSDGAVSEMKGVAFGIDPQLNVSDLTHFIPPYDIWQGAYRLEQTVMAWPAGTVFVGVVDPGVGSERRSIVAKLKSGHYFVGPDNGLLTFIQETIGVEETHIIDEKKHRRKGSEGSHTFFGRDVFTYVAAELASGKISFEQVGVVSLEKLVMIEYQKPSFQNNQVLGNIPVLDPNYGNVWTNISDVFLNEHLKAKNYKVEIFEKKRLVYTGVMPLVRTFSDVPEGKPLMYYNSLMKVSFALNMLNFSEKHHVKSGADWNVRITAQK